MAGLDRPSTGWAIQTALDQVAAMKRLCRRRWSDIGLTSFVAWMAGSNPALTKTSEPQARSTRSRGAIYCKKLKPMLYLSGRRDLAGGDQRPMRRALDTTLCASREGEEIFLFGFLVTR